MSGFVKRTPAIGVLRSDSRCGCNRGMLSICRAKSGDVLIKNQPRNVSASPLIAMLDCVCGAILPVRAATQFAHAQFHWGRPPPAALPRIWMRINRSYAVISPVRSDRARVTRALKKDRHGFQHRFDPALFGSSHELRRCHTSNGSYGSNYFFDEADVAASLDACNSNLGKVVGVRAKTHVLVQIMRGNVVAPHHAKIALAIAHDDVGLAFDQDPKPMGIECQICEEAVEYH